ncbi:MAG TPA: carboxypeptidase-like regulatory domain-containing protein, partial [Tepidiformaceae bacterium]|nr:carboxypeptidase-like regulatory domain-containing protein [Tepidiformaceae bacterium]
MHRPDSRALLLVLSLLLLPLPPRAARADASRMTGRVLDAGTLTPIAGAEVELANMNAGQGFFRTRSDKSGAFTIEGIAANRYYVLTVSAPGYADFILNAWQFPDAQRAVEVAIPLDRAGTLEVRATRANGRTAVPNARVAIVSERAARWWEGARPAPAPVFTDAKGVARFVDIQSGSWAVTVDLPGFLTAESRQVAVRRGETTTVPA